MRVLKKIENIIRKEMDKAGGQEILMSALQPKENWIKTGRWDSMDDLYKIKDVSKREFALGPTHEEIIFPCLKILFFPIKIYLFTFTRFRINSEWN